MLLHNPKEKEILDKIILLGYLTHIVFRLFENLKADPNDPQRFRLEICVSKGSEHNIKYDKNYPKHCSDISPLVSINTMINVK